MGPLTVYRETADGAWNIMWTRSGTQGDRSWHRVDLTVPQGMMRLVLVAVRGYHIYTTTSVDEIQLVPGECVSNCEYCKPTIDCIP